MALRWTLRELTAADREILRTATYHNVNWSGPERISYADVDHQRELRHYHALRPGRGDFGFVAEADGLTVGACWVQFFDATDPGYAFVDDGIPELSLSIWSGYRGNGIGRALLVKALQKAREREIEQVSLSVEEGNDRARKLYRSVELVDAKGAAPGTYLVKIG